jgi:FG-GAP repeat protein
MHPRFHRSYPLISVIVHCFAARALSQSAPPESFQAAVNYEAGAGSWSVAVGDFNGDGKLDLTMTPGS